MHSRNRRRGWALGLVFALGLLAVGYFALRRQTVEWQWRHYERQVREALAADDGRDVTEAITFFENATGVTSLASAGGGGTRTVTRAVEPELNTWESWYASHKACLKWDVLEQRLELRKGCGD